MIVCFFFYTKSKSKSLKHKHTHTNVCTSIALTTGENKPEDFDEEAKYMYTNSRS